MYGIKGEYDHALEYYQKALAIELKKLGADHPNVAASYNTIGRVHNKKGEYDKALEYYRKAAEQGQPVAQANLGIVYAAGRGVEKDPVEAYKWYSLAVTNGYTKAKSKKDALAKKMTPDQITKAEALAKEMIEQNPKLIQKKD